MAIVNIELDMLQGVELFNERLNRRILVRFG